MKQELLEKLEEKHFMSYTSQMKLKMTNYGAPGCPNRSTQNEDISLHQLSIEKKEEIQKK